MKSFTKCSKCDTLLLRATLYTFLLIAPSGCYITGNVLSSLTIKSVNSQVPTSSYYTVEDGGSSATIAHGIAADSSGNTYTTGYTSGTSSLDGQTSHNSNRDLFITKYNSSRVRQWTIQDGAAFGFTESYAITVDSGGSIYATGYTSVAIDGQTEHSSGEDFFITKYNSSGVLQWTVQDGPASGDAAGEAITTDSSGNVYVLGSTDHAVDGQTLHSVGGKDFFITKYNSSGVRQWTVEDGPTSNYIESFAGLVADAAGNIYAAGSTAGAIDGQTQHGGYDLFITKYNSSGTRQWTLQDGVSSGAYAGPIANGISIDSTGNLYIAGNTGVAIDGQTQHSSADLFITKYNSSGTLQWTTQDGPTPTSSALAIGQAIAVDSSGNAYATGYIISGSMDGQTEHGTNDLFITKYNSSGVQQWTIQDGGISTANTIGYGITIDSTGNISATGYTDHAIDGQTMHASSLDFFITKYNSSGVPSP